MRKYILVNGEPVVEPDVLKWAAWFEAAGPDVLFQRTQIGDIRVSTAFLGVDHSFSEEGPPVLWETMIFGGEHDQYCHRHDNKEEALIGHQAAVDLVNNEVTGPREWSPRKGKCFCEKHSHP